MSALEVGLPDGRALSAPSGATPLSLARQIGAGLARAALAARVDGALLDLRTPLHASCSLEIVTARDPQAGEVIRHSAEHLLASAVKRLYPEAQVDVGRSDHSEKFQYDFKVAQPFTPADLERIEKEMERIRAERPGFEREVITREAARKLFRELGEELKLSRIEDIPEGEEITLFRHGDFVDLCRGPHVQHAGQIGAFKLSRAAGAYWKGDESAPMLQRIYGTAFATREELDKHLQQQEEARERDHRLLGRRLGLFCIEPERVGPGLPLWLPKGATLRRVLADFLEEQLLRRGYQPVITPHIGKVDLYRTSGHYPFYADSQFPPIRVPGKGETDADEEYLLRPMNCPHHIQIYAHEKRSYRELPLRFAEFGAIYRYEKSGELGGLARARGFTVDDAHIFCSQEQVEGEFREVLSLVQFALGAFGFEKVRICLSVRDPKSGKFAGDPARWAEAEATLARVLEGLGLSYVREEGEAAFYGPKVDFLVTDAIGREWQLGTAQLDYVLPERFGLEYTGADGIPHRPVMIHRAPFGSFERFVGLLIEHTAGDFPLWLAPQQVAILPIADRHHGFAEQVQDALLQRGLRSFVDSRAEKLNYKIREAELQKIPVMAVLGDREQQQGSVSPRWRRGAGRGEGALPLADFAADLAGRVARREP